MVRVAITGVTGRMGKSLVQAAHQNDAIDLVAAVARTGNSSIGLDAGEHSGVEAINIAITEQLHSMH